MSGRVVGTPFGRKDHEANTKYRYDGEWRIEDHLVYS
jgi:hypothetical protein